VKPAEPLNSSMTAIPAIPARKEEDGNVNPDNRLDPLIRKATEATLEFTESLPSYICQEMIGRFESDSKPPSWRPLDVVSTNLVYENGREHYTEIKVNNKPVGDKKLSELGGAWSTGEFGSMLIDLFSPATDAEFEPQGNSRAAGIMAKKFRFSVKREKSTWRIGVGSQQYLPAYSGSVWIDPATARVLRVEMQAQGFPETFPADHVESAVDYEYVRLGDVKKYLLPVHAENLMCMRSSNYCTRNVIDFRNYRKFSGQSEIIFGPVKQ
jgi:hypothetical protein